MGRFFNKTSALSKVRTTQEPTPLEAAVVVAVDAASILESLQGRYEALRRDNAELGIRLKTAETVVFNADKRVNATHAELESTRALLRWLLDMTVNDENAALLKSVREYFEVKT